MSSVYAGPMANPQALHSARGAEIQGFGQRHLVLILLFTILTPVSYGLFAAAIGEKMHLGELPLQLIMHLAIATGAVSSAWAVDNRLRHRLGRVPRVLLAIAAGSVLGVGLIELGRLALIGPLGFDVQMSAEGKNFTGAAQRIAFEFIGTLRWSLVLVPLYELIEANRRAAARLYAARAAALAAEHELVEGGLRAMQARVDPDLLFDTLLDVDRAYAENVAAGQERLDALIRYLRAALPGDGAGTTTLAREQELALAFAALIRRKDGTPVDVRLSLDAGANDASLPPMLLLPMLRWGLAGNSVRTVSLGLRRRQDDLEITLDCDAHADDPPPRLDIERLRERLTQLFHGAARLDIRIDGGRRRALLAIPFTPAAKV